jgi:hypothetical protein
MLVFYKGPTQRLICRGLFFKHVDVVSIIRGVNLEKKDAYHIKTNACNSSVYRLCVVNYSMYIVYRALRFDLVCTEKTINDIFAVETMTFEMELYKKYTTNKN